MQKLIAAAAALLAQCTLNDPSAVPTPAAVARMWLEPETHVRHYRIVEDR